MAQSNIFPASKCGVVVEHRSMLVATRIRDASMVCNRPAERVVDGKNFCRVHFGVLEQIAARNKELGISQDGDLKVGSKKDDTKAFGDDVDNNVDELQLTVGDYVVDEDTLRSTEHGGQIEERHEIGDADTRELRWEGAGALEEREARRKEIELQHLNAFDIKDEKVRLEQSRRERNTDPDRLTTVPKPASAYKTPTYLHPGSTRPEDEVPKAPVFPENPVKASNSGQPTPDSLKTIGDKEAVNVEETKDFENKPFLAKETEESKKLAAEAKKADDKKGQETNSAQTPDGLKGKDADKEKEIDELLAKDKKKK